MSYVHYNQDDDCYYAPEGKIYGAELAVMKKIFKPNIILLGGADTHWGKVFIRRMIVKLKKEREYHAGAR